jgi:hypothetical protein
MSTQLIKTRIKNRVDTLAHWNSADPQLLVGEIAFVQVPTGTTFSNPVTGVKEPVVELLMKVGAYKKDASGNDTTTLCKFTELPWSSAKASDVYNWAKTATLAESAVPELPASRIVVVPDNETTKDINEKVTLADELENIAENIAGIRNTIAGGVHFVGIAKADTNFNSTVAAGTTATVQIKDGNTSTYSTHTLVEGDIVIKEDTTQEYIWTGTAWQELGDQTRIGALDTKVSGLDVDPTAAGTATAFIKSIKYDSSTQKLKAEKANIPVVSTSTSGTAGLTTLGVEGGAATYESVYGTSGAVSRVASIESNYIKFIANADTSKPGTLTVGQSGSAADYLIFDCGGASI